MRTARFAVLTAAVLVSLAVAAAAASSPHYSGTTSQGTSVSLRLSANHRRVALLRIYYQVSCDDNTPAHQTYTNIFNAGVRGDRFSATGIYKGSLDGSMDSYRIAGRLSTSRATGTFRWRASVTRNGRAVHCSSGRVTWSAQRLA